MNVITKNKYLLLIIMIQGLLVFYAFGSFILHADLYLFDPKYDGLKNYFTYYTYITDQQGKPFFHYNFMNYPFGDSVFFADNTIILSALLKLFHVENHLPFYHHLFFISGFVLASIAMFFLLSSLIKNKLLIVTASVCLPWITPQTMRIWYHFNLSFSFIIISYIYILLKTYKYRGQKINRKWIAIEFICLYLSGFFHIYYILILSILGLTFNFFSILSNLQKKQIILGLIHCALIAISLLLFIQTITYFDIYHDLRAHSAGGYDWENWKFRLENLVMRNMWFKVPFIYNYTHNIGYETHAYLGAFALYSIFLIPLYIYFKKQQKWESNKFLLLLMLSSLVLLSIAMGERCQITERNFTFTNYLNPFFYLHKITDWVTHFRCLGRFNWPFFISFNVAMLFICDRLLNIKKLRILIVIVGLLLVCDTYSVVDFNRNSPRFNSVFTEESMKKMKEVCEGIDAQSYQAILYLPFFHVGSEVSEYIIDPDENGCVEAFQLSYLMHLPLMDCKMSRTPEKQAISIFEFVTTGKPDNYLSSKLNSKEILIIVNNNLLEHGNKPTNEDVLPKYYAQRTILKSPKAKLIKSYGEYAIYSYAP